MFGKWIYPSNSCPIHLNLMENRTLKEMMDALLISSGLPQNLCGGTILTAKRNNKMFCFSERKQFCLFRTQSIPYEKWKGRKSNLKYFKVWGCLAKVQVPIPKRIKIGPKTVDCNIRLE